MAPNPALDTYDQMLKEIYVSVGQAVGIHVLMLVIERALWLTKNRYEEAAWISYAEEGVSLRRLSELNPDRAAEVAHTFVMTIVATLGRLIGKQLAQRMVEQLHLDTQEV